MSTYSGAGVQGHLARVYRSIYPEYPPLLIWTAQIPGLSSHIRGPHITCLTVRGTAGGYRISSARPFARSAKEQDLCIDQIAQIRTVCISGHF